MVKHIVFFKIKNDIKNKSQTANIIIDTLLPLKEKIPEIKFYELGMNFANKTTAFDIALISHFANRDDLDKYRNHPEHIKAAEKIKQYIAETASVDYEMPD
jgi:quinol monooxygenase YgiN